MALLNRLFAFLEKIIIWTFVPKPRTVKELRTLLISFAVTTSILSAILLIIFVALLQEKIEEIVLIKVGISFFVVTLFSLIQFNAFFILKNKPPILLNEIRGFVVINMLVNICLIFLRSLLFIAVLNFIFLFFAVSGVVLAAAVTVLLFFGWLFTGFSFSLGDTLDTVWEIFTFPAKIFIYEKKMLQNMNIENGLAGDFLMWSFLALILIITLISVYISIKKKNMKIDENE